MISRRILLASGLLTPLLAGARPAWAAAAEAAPAGPPSLYDLLREPGIVHAAISPSGKRVSLLGQKPAPGGGGFTTAIALIDGDDPAAAGKRLDLGDMYVERIAWANDERMLVWLKREFKLTTSGPMGSASTELTSRRLLAIGPDGSKPVILFENKKKDLKSNFDLGAVIDYMPADPDHIVMQAADNDRGVWALYRVNVQTGAAELMERGGDFTFSWASQNGLPIARYDLNGRGSVITLSLRAPGESDWTPYRRMRRDEYGRIEFDILAATDDPQVVLVSTATAQDPFIALRAFNLKTRQIGADIVRRPSHDVEGVVTDKAGRLVGTVFIEDRVGHEFADPSMKAHYRAIETAFGKACNIEIQDVDAAHNRFLLWVSGPREPGSYYFYDKTARRLEPLGAAREWLDPETLAPMEILSVAARDGQALTAYLTTPITGTGPRPMVVLPHGGPEARDQLAWDDWVQALAARGWLVLQPNFRGSEGYGRAFIESGWRRWGDRMQEDVEDCVARVIADGRADPAHVAIMGASYGGYAALMGAVRRPELYKACVAIAGVSDLPDMLAWEKAEEGYDSPAYDYWRRNMGDPDTDRAMLETASPRRRAGEITAPVLLIHGKDDDIVPAIQSKIMRDALRKAGRSVDYLEIEDMGHRNWKPQQSMTVLGKAIAFLEPRLKA